MVNSVGQFKLSMTLISLLSTSFTLLSLVHVRVFPNSNDSLFKRISFPSMLDSSFCYLCYVCSGTTFCIFEDYFLHFWPVQILKVFYIIVESGQGVRLFILERFKSSWNNVNKNAKEVIFKWYKDMLSREYHMFFCICPSTNLYRLFMNHNRVLQLANQKLINIKYFYCRFTVHELVVLILNTVTFNSPLHLHFKCVNKPLRLTRTIFALITLLTLWQFYAMKSRL